jgi:glycosyltransferase involved in cell wall biosynthesis
MSVGLTVLIATRDRADVLEVTLEAMCRVRREALCVEFVVVDNGSTDRTSAVLKAFEGRLPLRVLNEPTAGKCHALNRALKGVALRDIVVFTDDDVTPDAAWLENIVATCERWPAHSVFGGRIDVEWPVQVAIPGWAKHQKIQQMAFSAHHVSEREREYAPRTEPFGPNYWVRRTALAGVEFCTGIGPHPTRRTLGDETHFLRLLRGRGFTPVYTPSARVGHRIEVERTTREAIYRRSFQYGRGYIYSEGLPEDFLRQRSRAAWHLRLMSNVGVGALGVVRAALEPDEDLRFLKVVTGLTTLAKNVEALRASAQGTWARLSGQVPLRA